MQELRLSVVAAAVASNQSGRVYALPTTYGDDYDL